MTSDALRHLDGLRFRNLALIILSIADDDDRLAQRVIGTILQEFVFARVIDSVVERRSAAIMQLVHAGRRAVTRCR